MAEVITMPRLSDTMEEGTLVKWCKNINDKISEGDILAEIETDKATQEFESYLEGVLLYKGVEEQASAKVGDILVIIGQENEDITPFLSNTDKTLSQSPIKQEEEIKTDDLQIKKEEDFKEEPNKRILISPVARKIAKKENITLKDIKGSGPNGRIILKDIEAKIGLSNKEDSKESISKEDGSLTQKKIVHSRMRKIIAKRLVESKLAAPHYYLTMEVNMSEIKKMAKGLLDKTAVKITINDIVIKASALAMKEHPLLNVSWQEDEMIQYEEIHVGVAVAIEGGLVVPVITDVNKKTLTQISSEVKLKVKRAREGKLDLKEKSTFTVSNLGMFGIESFTSIINPPNSCILSVGAIIQKPIVKEGVFVIGDMMKITLACDHRAIDGTIGSAYLKTLKEILEDPIMMLV